MENAQEILAISFVVFLAMTVLATHIPGSIGLAAILGKAEFNYRFDRTRIPLCIGAVVSLVLLSFVYGFVIARDLVLAFQFCLGVSFFGTIGFITGICYVRE